MLITWPRYNNMDYSYPHFARWRDASRGKGFFKFTGFSLSVWQQKSNGQVWRYHAEIFPLKDQPSLGFNYTLVLSSQLSQDQLKEEQQGDLWNSWRFFKEIPASCADASICAEANIRKFLINSSVEQEALDWFDVITWSRLKKNPLNGVWIDSYWPFMQTLKSMEISARSMWE